MDQLTVTEIKALTEAGRYNDGDGLILNFAPGGSKSWILRVQSGGKRRDIGLGSTNVLTLTEARASHRFSMIGDHQEIERAAQPVRIIGC